MVSTFQAQRLWWRHTAIGCNAKLAANVSELAYHACCTKSSGYTHIFMVPFGPRLLLSTSCSPRAALMLTARAAWALATSALGFRAFTAAIAQHNQRSTSKKYRRLGVHATLVQKLSKGESLSRRLQHVFSCWI